MEEFGEDFAKAPSYELAVRLQEAFKTPGEQESSLGGSSGASAVGGAAASGALAAGLK